MNTIYFRDQDGWNGKTTIDLENGRQLVIRTSKRAFGGGLATNAPVWHIAGFALGAATALMGEKAAMACTVAVEEVIDEHYAGQHAELGDDQADLKDTIETFRQEELEHRDIGLDHGAEETPGYELLSGAVKAGSRLAIWLSERF